MKNTLWVFGDSFSHSLKNQIKESWITKYTKWKGYEPDTFGDIISNKLNLELINLSMNGADNYSIFEKVCEMAFKIKEGDIIIIGWSRKTRFRVANNEKGEWNMIAQINEKLGNDDELYKLISKNTIEQLLVNRDNILYANEVNNWTNLLNVTFKNNIIINWTWCEDEMDIHVLNLNYRRISTILQESSGKHLEGHYGEIGHQHLSYIFLDIIEKPTNKKIL
jgi:hypothetical protein